MKKGLLILLVLISFKGFGQTWNVAGDNSSSGKLTIGDTIKSEKGIVSKGRIVVKNNYFEMVPGANQDAIIKKRDAGNLNISSGGGSSQIRFNFNYGGGSGGILLFDGGQVNHAGLIVNSSGHLNMFASGGNVGIGAPSPVNKFQIGANAVGYAGNDFVVSNANGSLAINNTGTEAFLWASKPIAIRPGGVYALYAASNGNVGIGTTVTDARLTVKGDIHTSEVRIDLEEEVAPDYVFEKDYNLLPLAEVEAYINENKHLPEVPSAKEMDANGLNVKQMNLLLLKKVEELTLHLIEMKKENEKMQERLNKLENK